jgi:hypothetical protein
LISWTAPSDDGGKTPLTYKVFSDNALGASTVEIAETSSTQYLATGLSAGSTYRFQVLAYNSVDQGLKSAAASFLAATASSEPTNLLIVNTAENEVEFSWSAPSDDGGDSVTDYEVFWDNKDGDLAVENFVSLGMTGGDTSYLKQSLSAGSLYRFVVVAHNSIKGSPRSAPLTIMAATAP